MSRRCRLAARAIGCRRSFRLLPLQIGYFDAGCSARWTLFVVSIGGCGAAGAYGIVDRQGSVTTGAGIGQRGIMVGPSRMALPSATLRADGWSAAESR